MIKTDKITKKTKTFSHLAPLALIALFLALFSNATPAFADTPLYGTCTAIPYNGVVGDVVNWQAQGVTGGNGTYTYAWSGTDALTGSNQTVYKTYTYPGTKTATVTITSGGQVYTATCSVNVASSNGYYYNNGYNTNYPYGYSGTLAASCYSTPTVPNVNDNVTWYGSATGGSGNYTYSWSGTDGLYGTSQTVYKSYPTPGTKTAFLTVYSNGQTITQTCSTNVGGGYTNGGYYNNYSNNYPYNGTGFNGTGYNGSYPYGYNGYTGSTNYNGNSGFYTTSQGSYYGNGYNNGYNTGYNNYNNGYYNNPPVNSYSPTTYAPTTYAYPTTYTTRSGTPVAGVFLNQVPSTGKSFNLKMALFVIGLIAWSLFAAFIIQIKRKSTLAAAGTDQVSRIESFKRMNLEKKGLIK